MEKENLKYLFLNEPRPKLPKPTKCSTCKLKNKNLLWCGNKNKKIKYNNFTWKCKLCFSNYNIM